MTPRYSFRDRLELARRLIARRTQPPIPLADQLNAAGSEARAFHDLIGEALPILQPDRNWRRRLEVAPADEVKALILAAVIGCTTMCVHLRRLRAAPAFVQLPLRRIDCTRCIRTLRRPPPDEADCCDICEARGVVTFVPFAAHHGPALVVGDACPSCANVLGIRQEASA